MTNIGRKPTVTINGVTFNLGREDGMATCINVGETFSLSKKQVKKLYENGEVTLKNGTYIEVYYD